MKKRPLLATAVIAALTLAACGGSDSAAPDTTAAAATGVDLVAAGCPATVSLQTDWNPEAEHGNLYQLIGPGYTVDKEKLRVTGDLMAGGKTTGVKVEIRAGGPAIGYSQVTAELYKDPSILLGFTSTDEAVSHSGDEFPTVAVVAPFNINPQIIMWDPATYPEVKTIGDLKATGAKVRYFDGAAYWTTSQQPESLTRSKWMQHTTALLRRSLLQAEKTPNRVSVQPSHTSTRTS